MNLKKIEAAAQAAQLHEETRRLIQNSRMEFRIANYEMSGECIRFSKELALVLGITQSADILLMPYEGLIMVAEKLPFDAACTVALNDDRGAKVVYIVNVINIRT